MKVYTALDESLVTNLALGFASCYICHSTLISAVYFIQTGGTGILYTLGIFGAEKKQSGYLQDYILDLHIL